MEFDYSIYLASFCCICKIGSTDSLYTTRETRVQLKHRFSIIHTRSIINGSVDNVWRNAADYPTLEGL